MSDHISYSSEFLPSITIFVVFSDDPQYEHLKPLFEEYGYGFMIPNKNMILIDGEILLEKGYMRTLLME